jgi:3-phosphoshikimate 1-carboxyvinyltransferase
MNDMDKIIKTAKKVYGKITLPGDKSISHRAMILSSLCKGDTTIINYSKSQEFKSTLNCLGQYGVECDKPDDNTLVVHGRGIEGFSKPDGVLDAGNSSATVRLLLGLAAACPFESRFDGSEKLKTRPMRRVIEPLDKMGARIESDNFRVPVRIEGGDLKAIRYIMPLSTSQVKGAVFTAALFTEGETELIERFPSRDHFEKLMDLMKIKYTKERIRPTPTKFIDEFERRMKKKNKSIFNDPRGDLFRLPGGQTPTTPATIEIPGDISAAAMFVAAAVLVNNSELVIEDVCLNPTRMGFLDILSKMRANLNFEATGYKGREPVGTITAKTGPLKGRRIVGEMIPIIIDELPIMAVLATQAYGTTVIRDAFELRHKETDRIKTVVTNLRKMGARIGELDDGMAIDGGTPLEGAEITTYGDHRIAMAFAIAGLVAKGETLIKDAEYVATSHPTFWEYLDSLVEY